MTVMDQLLNTVSLFTGITYFSIITFLATPLRYSVKKSVIITIFSILINFVLNIYFVLRFNVGLPHRIFLLTIPAVMFLYQDMISSESGYRQIFIFFTSWWINLMLIFFTSVSRVLAQGDSVYLLMEFYTFMPICGFVVFFFRKSFFDIIQRIDRGWAKFATVPASFCAILFLIHAQPFSPNFNNDYIFVSILIFAMAISVYKVINVYFLNACRYQDKTKANEILRIHTEFQKKSVDSINQKLRDLEDFKNQTVSMFQDIYEALSENDAERSIEHIAEIGDTIKAYEFEYFCENYVLNTILSKYIHKAREENIDASVRLSVPESVNIDVIELCLVFSNAIENAINASLKIKNVQNRKISVLASMADDRICIRIVNRFEGKVHIINGLPYSGRHNHGIGTRSIMSIAEKYGGFCSFEAKDNIFSLNMVL